MTLKERYAGVIGWFEANMPVAESELQYKDPYQLLVAVILSAQCTDKRVNMTTPALFEAYPTPEAMAQATAEEIYAYIKSISYPNNKARNLAAMARMLCTEFGGVVPSDLDALQRLPGVGRKSANLILGDVFHQPGAVVVDTHCIRLSNRIGLPRVGPHRAYARRQNPAPDRVAARKEHPVASAARGASLVDSPRPLRLHGAGSEVRRLRDRAVVQEP